MASEVVSRLGEYGRTNTAILDAFLQRSMQIELSGTWDKLRDQGYRGPFFMIHNTGGCADLFKTTASRTYNGGPVAGLIGARNIGRQIGVHDRSARPRDPRGHRRRGAPRMSIPTAEQKLAAINLADPTEEELAAVAALAPATTRSASSAPTTSSTSRSRCSSAPRDHQWASPAM